MSAATRGLDGAVGERIELRISVSAGADESDLLVRAASSDLVRELARALTAELGGRAGQSLWCERRGELLDEDTTLARAGIRWGDRLRFEAARTVREPTRIGGTAKVELVVTGGPCAGERFELGDGVYRLGREPGVDILIADPSLSRHHLDLRVDSGGTSAADAGSSNGTALNGEALRPAAFRELHEHDELELGRTLVRVTALAAAPDHGVAQHDGRLAFNRPPRVNPPREPFSQEISAPPSKGRKARLPLAASLVPLLAGVLLFVLLKSPVMLAVAGLSPLMAISTYVSDRRGGKKSFARESREFQAQLGQAIATLEREQAAEALARRAESPDAPTLLARLSDLAPTLWERRPSDTDFMNLRIGVADLAAQSSLTIASGGDPDIRSAAEKRVADRGVLPSVPMTLDLRRVGVVGLAGNDRAEAGLARWLLLQAAILHSPGELVILAAVTSETVEEWSWLKWWPHARPDRVGLQGAPIALGRVGAEDLLSELRDLALQRRALARTQAGTGVRPPQVLALIDEETGVDRALVSAALTDVGELGIAVVWLGRHARDLPGQVGAIVEIEDARAVLSVTDVASGERVAEVTAEGVSVELAARTARLLAPVRDVSELARAGDIPKRVGLLDLLGLLPPTAEELENRWTNWRGDLSATVGVGATGALRIDLRSEGPHALIAGTTGSGKSELLRTLVAAAAAAIPPNRLSFLLVDYKGGAAFAPCAALPHVVDIVSDLDDHMAERALISLNAELKRREHVLAREGAKDLLELAHRNPDAAPPLLIIAVDEFAKLREEVPQFVDGVVDIAQRGRSLGVHMVLAAQTLRNAFTPAIRANTNLRLALRVSEESESEDMIASPLAARIPSGESSRGRAFARTGHGELREFQAAYISGLSDIAGSHEVQIAPFDLEQLANAKSASNDASDSDAESDLVALGEAARTAQIHMQLSVPPPPWLPMLPAVLALDELPAAAGEEGIAIGLVDLPHIQRQDALVLDLDRVGHVAIFGAGNSGKTTALTTTALALSHSTSSDDLSIYCLDAAGGDLAPLKALPHCGDVVMVDEAERVQRLLRVLLRKVERRASRTNALEGSAGSPRTVLLLDDFGAFAREYDRPGPASPYEQLQQILAGGRGAGVHVILTASRRGAIPAAVATHFGQRLVLRMPTEEDMLSLGLDAKTVRGARLPVGRGFTQDTREFQVAVPAEHGEVVPLQRALGAAKPLPGSGAAAPIEVLPARVERSKLGRADSLAAIPLGISDEDLGPAHVDLSEMHMLVAGPYRSGRSTALATIVEGVHEVQRSVALYLLAPRRSPLRDLDLWSVAATSANECSDLASSLVARAEAGDFDREFAILLIDDGGELSDARSVTQLEQLVRLGRDSALRIVAAVETGSARGIGNSWIREIRREGHGLLLQPDLGSDGDLLATRLPRQVPAPLTPGRGFIVVRGSAELVQVAS